MEALGRGIQQLSPNRAEQTVAVEQESGVDVDMVEQSRRTFEAAARPTARLEDGMRERDVARGPGHSPPR